MRKLALGEATEVRIDSRPRWCATGVWLDAGANYDIVAAGTWVDWTEKYRCGPDGYASGSLLLRIAERCRNERSQPWFALMGAISRNRRSQFLIGSRRVLRPEVAGELTCFANDIAPMRWNNKGSLRLTVTRTG